MKDFGNIPMESKVEAAAGAMLFVVFHEVGHALSHMLNLPILGKEEDAADAIANYILLHTNNPLPAIIGSVWFFTNATTQPTIRDFAGEHSLGPQRAFSMLCYALGMDPVKYEEVATRFKLPQERATRCAGEYQQLKASTKVLLRGHLAANAP